MVVAGCGGGVGGEEGDAICVSHGGLDCIGRRGVGVVHGCGVDGEAAFYCWF